MAKNLTFQLAIHTWQHALSKTYNKVKLHEFLWQLDQPLLRTSIKCEITHFLHLTIPDNLKFPILLNTSFQLNQNQGSKLKFEFQFHSLLNMSEECISWLTEKILKLNVGSDICFTLKIIYMYTTNTTKTVKVLCKCMLRDQLWQNMLAPPDNQFIIE